MLGSRILGGYALRGGMPIWKYIANRFLTAAENLAIGAKLMFIAALVGIFVAIAASVKPERSAAA